MTLDLATRVSGYLTLALAAGCLVCADAAFVPILPPLLVPALVLLVAAFVAEGRGWVLPAWAANVAGLLIVGAIAAGTVAYATDGQDDGDVRPLALVLLPYIGPVVIVLVLVKLFRAKTASELWGLQGLGLLMAGLGCVLAEGGLFGALLLAYAACGTWHLALAYLRREEMRTAAAPGTVPWHGLGLPQGARWVLAAVLMALPAFFLAPRVGDDAWSPLIFAGPHADRSRLRAEVGLGGGIDLNGTETLDPVDEEVVAVEAFRDAALTEPKTDLSPRQRWRGLTLDSYDNGRWHAGHSLVASSMLMDQILVSGRMVMPPPVAPQPQLPDLGRGQFFLKFTAWPMKAGGLVVAEPAVVRGKLLPVITEPGENRGRRLFQETLGIVVPLPLTYDRAEVRYRQVVPAAADPDLSEPAVPSQRYASLIAQQPVAALGTWARDLARRLAARPDSGLGAADLDPVPTAGGGVGPRDPERLARALTVYLASSGDYAYSFEQERADPGLDPTLDFLTNVRHGPCTRFASALALMLRSLGVPARVVLGFRGCEHLGDGRYQILSSQAHAWVEILVTRPGPGGATQWHWLTLDPTPPADAVPRPAFSLARWWERHRFEGTALWREYVVDYNPGAPGGEVLGSLGGGLGRTRESLREPLPGGLVVGLAVPAAGLGIGYLVWRKRRRPVPRRVGARVPFYARLLDVLARAHGLRPRRAQTPREFAEEAGRILREKETAAAVAEVPARVAELFYRVAYGGRPLTDGEAREVEHCLALLVVSRSRHATRARNDKQRGG